VFKHHLVGHACLVPAHNIDRITERAVYLSVDSAAESTPLGHTSYGLPRASAAASQSTQRLDPALVHIASELAAARRIGAPTDVLSSPYGRSVRIRCQCHAARLAAQRSAASCTRWSASACSWISSRVTYSRVVRAVLKEFVVREMID
jgi:hypothetical protein